MGSGTLQVFNQISPLQFFDQRLQLLSIDEKQVVFVLKVPSKFYSLNNNSSLALGKEGHQPLKPEIIEPAGF